MHLGKKERAARKRPRKRRGGHWDHSRRQWLKLGAKKSRIAIRKNIIPF